MSHHPWAKVHYLVHPGFDAGEHPEFESYLHAYIEHIAQETNDILLIVSDGESFDLEQIRKFAHLDIIEGISLYLSLHDGGAWDIIQKINPSISYQYLFQKEWFDARFYRWCEEHIDMSELHILADTWRILREDYITGKYRENGKLHDDTAARLRIEEEQARMKLDIATLSLQALEELWAVKQRKQTQRNIKNPARFHRLYQHAMEALGKNRMREIFIADQEEPDMLPINPVSHFQDTEGNLAPTPIAQLYPDFEAQVFNASENFIYGNAARVKDRITYELSLSRHQKLRDRQAKNVLKDMDFEANSETEMIFLGEYRHRCVNNVLRILTYRLSPLTGDNFFIANDTFTLERPDNYIGTDWE